MKTRRFFVIPFAVALAFAPQLFAQHGDPGSRSYAAKLLSPKAGDVLVPGQQVTIRWESRLPDVDLTWCEAEIYLSLDGGRSNVMRITPQLDPRIGYYDWTVPNLPTNAAVLDIHFGCEGYFPERPSIQAQAAFVIGQGTGIVREIAINPVSAAEAFPGNTVQISWNSSVENVTSFELQISYDRGAHFHRLIETKELQFAWDVPNDFAGHATFRVVAHTAGGGHVDSAISAEPQVIVRARPE